MSYTTILHHHAASRQHMTKEKTRQICLPAGHWRAYPIQVGPKIMAAPITVRAPPIKKNLSDKAFSFVGSFTREASATSRVRLDAIIKIAPRHIMTISIANLQYIINIKLSNSARYRTPRAQKEKAPLAQRFFATHTRDSTRPSVHQQSHPRHSAALGCSARTPSRSSRAPATYCATASRSRTCSPAALPP